MEYKCCWVKHSYPSELAGEAVENNMKMIEHVKHLMLNFLLIQKHTSNPLTPLFFKKKTNRKSPLTTELTIQTT